MFSFIWPVLIVIAGYSLYNVVAKETPGDVHPFASLTITYLVAALLSLILFFILGNQSNLAVEMGKANWTALALAFVLVAIEVGYIYVYRVGWKISLGNLVANIGFSSLLVLVGVLIYKESLAATQMIGIIAALVGIALVNWPAKEKETEVAEELTR